MRAEHVLMIEVTWIELAWSKVGGLSKVRWPETRRKRLSTRCWLSEIRIGTGSNSISPLWPIPWGHKVAYWSWQLLRPNTNESWSHVMWSWDRCYRSLKFWHKWWWWRSVEVHLPPWKKKKIVQQWDYCPHGSHSKAGQSQKKLQRQSRGWPRSSRSPKKRWWRNVMLRRWERPRSVEPREEERRRAQVEAIRQQKLLAGLEVKQKAGEVASRSGSGLKGAPKNVGASEKGKGVEWTSCDHFTVRGSFVK